MLGCVRFFKIITKTLSLLLIMQEFFDQWTTLTLYECTLLSTSLTTSCNTNSKCPPLVIADNRTNRLRQFNHTICIYYFVNSHSEFIYFINRKREKTGDQYTHVRNLIPEAFNKCIYLYVFNLLNKNW